MFRVARPVSLFLLVVGLPACGDEREAAPPDEAPPVVATTFYPTTYMVERIAGDRVEIRCPIPSDADPGHWMPPDDVIAAYQAADLIVLNGAGFEHWVAKVSLPASRVLDTTAAKKDEFLRYEEAVTHSHGPEGAHVHEGIDGHTWLDPVFALAQAEAIHDALAKLGPEHAYEFSARFARLRGDLKALDDDWKALAAGYEGAALYANHPAYNYLAKRYGLPIVNLDLDPETVPPEATLEAIRGQLAEVPGRALLWESQPTDAVAARVREALGLESVVISPCESFDDDLRAAGADFLSVMRQNLETVRPLLVGK